MPNAHAAFTNALTSAARGEAILSASTIDSLALDAIAELLGNEWNSDLFNEVADCVRQSGRAINDA